MTKIAFIGLGNMGGGMAANLAKAGHDVRAFDLDAEALNRAKQAGCLPVQSAAEAVVGAEAVITMLPAGAHVAATYKEAVFSNAAPSAVLIDCSTIDVPTARELAAAAAARGLEAVDAPVSGGIAAANGGTLTFMVGGTAKGFEEAQLYLEAMGKAVIHAGDSGAGQAVKMCNNLILAGTMIATCEGLALAERLGLDLQVFYDIASKATAQSWSLNTYCPVPGVGPESPADRNYEGGFAAALMLKDLRLAMGAAERAGVDLPFGTHATELYSSFVNGGNAGTDFSGIIRTLQDKP